MKLILCLDERNGMAFNQRRQSSDRALCARILEICKGSKLWMNSYSAKLFTTQENILVDGEFISKAGQGEYCFVENTQPAGIPEEIWIFRWDRHYPADVYFPAEMLQKRELVRRESFAGYSHEMITLEVYR